MIFHETDKTQKLHSPILLFSLEHVREGRKLLKRYSALFTCISSKAIHPETANYLITDSFINAYRHSVKRRVPLFQLRSDQRTNLIGTKKELVASSKEFNQKIKREC